MTFKVCIPHHGVLDVGLVEWLTKNNHQPLFQRSYSVSKGRNVLTHRFLEECNEEWLFFLDYDMWPVDDGIFEILEKTDKECLFVPGITTHLKWNFSFEDVLPSLKKYKPKNKNYFLKPITFFGGAGIFLKRGLLEKLPKDMWRESSHKHTTSGEDILFSTTLVHTYKVPAQIIYNSALHHSKNGFDLYSLVGKL